LLAEGLCPVSCWLLWVRLAVCLQVAAAATAPTRVVAEAAVVVEFGVSSLMEVGAAAVLV
jgi:hypothetical protein